MTRVMGPKSIPIRTTLTPEVKISTSQDAPTLRQQKSKPRAMTTKSLSPELTATENEIQEAPTLRTSNEETTKIMNKEKTEHRELSDHRSTYHTSRYHRYRNTHEAQKTNDHASSRNQIDLLHISTVQEQDNMSKPVTTQGLPSHGSTSNEDRGGGYAKPNIGVPATPKNTITKISKPSSGPDPELTNTLSMGQIQAMLDKTARDIIDDLTKQTDAVRYSLSPEGKLTAATKVECKRNERSRKVKGTKRTTCA